MPINTFERQILRNRQHFLAFFGKIPTEILNEEIIENWQDLLISVFFYQNCDAIQQLFKKVNLKKIQEIYLYRDEIDYYILAKKNRLSESLHEQLTTHAFLNEYYTYLHPQASSPFLNDDFSEVDEKGKQDRVATWNRYHEFISINVKESLNKNQGLFMLQLLNQIMQLPNLSSHKRAAISQLFFEQCKLLHHEFGEFTAEERAEKYTPEYCNQMLNELHYALAFVPGGEANSRVVLTWQWHLLMYCKRSDELLAYVANDEWRNIFVCYLANRIEVLSSCYGNPAFEYRMEVLKTFLTRMTVSQHQDLIHFLSIEVHKNFKVEKANTLFFLLNELLKIATLNDLQKRRIALLRGCLYDTMGNHESACQEYDKIRSPLGLSSEENCLLADVYYHDPYFQTQSDHQARAYQHGDYAALQGHAAGLTWMYQHYQPMAKQYENTASGVDEKSAQNPNAKKEDKDVLINLLPDLQNLKKAHRHTRNSLPAMLTVSTPLFSRKEKMLQTKMAIQNLDNKAWWCGFWGVIAYMTLRFSQGAQLFQQRFQHLREAQSQRFEILMHEELWLDTPAAITCPTLLIETSMQENAVVPAAANKAPEVVKQSDKKDATCLSAAVSDLLWADPTHTEIEPRTEKVKVSSTLTMGLIRSNWLNERFSKFTNEVQHQFKTVATF